MKKSELKNSMFVKTRDDDVFVVVDDVLVGVDGFMWMEEYDNDLRCDGVPELDIMYVAKDYIGFQFPDIDAEEWFPVRDEDNMSLYKEQLNNYIEVLINSLRDLETIACKVKGIIEQLDIGGGDE